MLLHRNRTLLLFLACLALGALAGGLHFCGGARSERVSLTILTPHGDNIRQEIGAAFSAWHQVRYGPAPELDWMDQGGTSENLHYVQSRFARNPASAGIDLLFGGGAAPYRTLARDGFLQPRALDRERLREIPARLTGIPLYADSDGWYGSALASFGILYNRKILAEKRWPEPLSWRDLALPRAYQWVACVDPRGSGSAHVIYEIVLQKFGWEAGWEILTRTAANSNHFTKGASGVLPLISTGEAAYSVAIDQYAWSLLESVGPDRIGFLLPAGETVTTPDPIAMLKGAPHGPEARRFLEFVFSESCQMLWMLKAGFPGGPARLSLNRMAVLPGLYPKLDSGNSFVAGNPFAEGDVAGGGLGWAYSDSLTEARWSWLNDALGLWMIDIHDRARAVWEPAVRRAEKGDPDWEKPLAGNRFFRPPGTWEEARAQMEHWGDGNFRNAEMARWARELHD